MAKLIIIGEDGSKVTNEQIDALLTDHGLTVETVIDRVIQLNGIIGVGRFSLGEHLKDYCITHKGYVK